MGLLSRPIFGRRLDAPYIARLIQRQSEQPKLLILSDQDTVYSWPTGAVLLQYDSQTQLRLPVAPSTAMPRITPMSLRTIMIEDTASGNPNTSQPINLLRSLPVRRTKTNPTI